MQIGFGLSLSSARRSVQMVNVLDAISWNRASYPLTFAKNGGVWSCDFDRSDYLPDGAIVTSYWVSTAGNNANNGLSSGAPKRSIHAAITAGNATGQPYRVTVAAGLYGRADGFTGSSGTVVPTQDCIFTTTGGRVVCAHAEVGTLSWPGSKDATYQNTTIVARTNVGGVIDLLSPDSNGDYSRLTRVADAATCNSTPGSWAQVGSNLHVNRGDGAVGSNTNLRVFLRAVGSAFTLAAGSVGKKVFAEGFDFQGGGAGGAVQVANAATNVILMMQDCTAKYAGDDTAFGLNGFAVAGSGLFVFENCRASSCTADGFNGHWTTDSSRATFMLTINCTGSKFGTLASNNSNNGLTIHETVVAIDINGVYANSRGGCIRNIGDSRMLALGTRSGPDASGGGITPAAFRVDDTAVIYAVDAEAIASSASDYSALTTGTGKIYLRGYTPGIGIVSGTTAMPSTVYVGPTSTYTAPANTVAPSISGETTQGATLTATAGTWTGTPTPTIAGQWRVNGADVPGATSSTFSTSSLAVGDVVTYRETATNVVSAVSATSSGVTLTAPDAAPVNTVLPAISGDDTVGSTLTATTGTWTGSPTPTYAYQWRANGSDVSGATSSTFATTLLSAGDVVTCRVTATNIAGSASATSSGVTLTADTGPTEIPDAIILSGRSSEMVAPEGITFSPDLALVGTHFGISAPGGVYDARMHDVYYVWSFGDAGSFSAPQHLLPEHMDRNRATGPAVAHVYRTPGTYTARLDMYGTIAGAPAHAYSERTVTVGSSASMFAGAQTYFVSPSSDWTNAPSGSQHITSLDDAAGWANEGGGPYRIMLNRGETHTWGGRRFGFNTPEACTIHVVAGPGGEAKPILTCTGSFGCGGFDDATYVNKTFVAQGLVLNGPYDPITPGEPEVTGAFGSFGDYTPQQMLIDDCEIRNFGSFLYIADNTSRHIYMHDNIMEGYGQWGVTGSHADGLVLLGNRILSAAGAPIDNDANMGGTVRTGAGVMTFISHANDIECAQGWSGLGGGYIAVQPCIRVESEGVAGQTINITNCTFAGGFTQLSIANGDDPSVILNAIIDGCYFLGSYQSGDVIGTENAGTIIRNNVAVIPNPATRFGPGLSSFVTLGNVGGGASLVPPMKVYGNTIVNLTTDTLGIVSNSPGYSNVTIENNVVHQPNASPAQTADAPLVTTPALWTPREMGYMDRATPRITASATPSGTPAAYSLDTGSDAIGDATTGLIPPFNIVGDERADPPNRGAW